MRDRGKKAAATAARRGRRRGRAGGEEIRQKKITAGGLNTAVKRTAGTTGQGAGTTGEPERGNLRFVGFWPTGATELRPVPPAGHGTTQRWKMVDLVWQTLNQIKHDQISAHHYKTMAIFEMLKIYFEITLNFS
jgi:hypothetical protein